MRRDKRENDELRNIGIEMDYQRNNEGSCLISFGNTRVICSVYCNPGVPQFLSGTGKGWLTAEYAMLPGATQKRKQRDGVFRDGRSVEIQRLIGRSLRSVLDTKLLGERTVAVDCDVLDADGGTRTAAITGAWCAVAAMVNKRMLKGDFATNPLSGQVAGVSCGMVKGDAMLDLDYSEDSTADVDMNIVMTSAGGFVELQGTGEGRTFADEDMLEMIRLAKAGMQELFRKQREATGWRL